MKSQNPQFKLRLPDELKEKLERAASKEDRSVGAEIVSRLEQSFSDELARKRAHSLADWKMELDTLVLLKQDFESDLAKLRQDKAAKVKNWTRPTVIVRPDATLDQLISELETYLPNFDAAIQEAREKLLELTRDAFTAMAPRIYAKRRVEAEMSRKAAESREAEALAKLTRKKR